MTIKHLAACIAAFAGISAALPAQAAYNVYSKDGLSVDFGGGVAAQYKKRWEKSQVQGESRNFSETDRRARMGLDRGSSWLNMRGTQRINQDWTAAADVQLGYYDDNVNLQMAKVALERRNWGSVSLGKQWLHTNYVPRSDTFYPLDSYGGSSIRADFTYVPDLQVSAYQIFPSNDDVRKEDSNNEVQGNGLSASYLYRIAPDHTVRFAAGVSRNKKNPQRYLNNTGNDDQGWDHSWSAKKTTAAAASVEYTFNKVTLAADIAKDKKDIDSYYVDKSDTKYWGVKAEYEITPRARVSTSYGRANTKKTAAARQEFSSSHLGVDSAAFPKIRESRIKVKAEYDLRDNVQLYSRFSRTETKNSFDSGEYSKPKNREITAGVSVTF